MNIQTKTLLAKQRARRLLFGTLQKGHSRKHHGIPRCCHAVAASLGPPPTRHIWHAAVRMRHCFAVGCRMPFSLYEHDQGMMMDMTTNELPLQKDIQEVQILSGIKPDHVEGVLNLAAASGLFSSDLMMSAEDTAWDSAYGDGSESHVFLRAAINTSDAESWLALSVSARFSTGKATMNSTA